MTDKQLANAIDRQKAKVDKTGQDHKEAKEKLANLKAQAKERKATAKA